MSQLAVPGALPFSEVNELLKKYFKCGDEVIQLGKRGVVVGFGEKYIARGGLQHKFAGTYIDFGQLIVASTDGRSRASMCHVYMDHKLHEVYMRTQDVYIRIGDLPETPFWEGDTVSYPYRGGATQWVVKRIDSAVGRETIYTIQIEGGAYACNVIAMHLKLVSHGNLWKMEHGEPLDFPSIEEEALFFKSLGMSRNVTEFVSRSSLADNRRDAAPKLHCELKEALCAIRKWRIADEVKIINKDMKCVVIKYDDEVFGNRMRAHTLAKFGLTEEAPT